MLIRDQLKKAQNFTPNEKEIALFILKNSDNFDEFSTRQIAKKTFTSPSAIVRLCHRLGFSGFDEFKNKFIEETDYLSLKNKELNANFPFDKNDTVREVVGKITNLYLQTIKDTQNIMDFQALLRCRKICDESKEIHIFSYGTYLNQAYAFEEKMTKMGKKVHIQSNLNYQLYDAESMEAGDIAIIISYSGETKNCLEIANLCRQKNIPVISFTSVGGNSLSKVSDEVLYISTQETLYENIADYSIHLSVSYLLDILYSIIFQQDFDHYYQRKIDLAHLLENHRDTDNSIIR